MTRLALLALVLGLTGCRCGKVTSLEPGELTVAPGTLEFGKLAIGSSLTLKVVATNLTRAPRQRAVTVEGPFQISVTQIDVPAGGDVTLEVGFTATQLGPVEGTLTIEGASPVALRAEGIAACTTSKICTAIAFDLTTRGCIESASLDGTACSTACLSAGQCQQGVCVGQSSSCDDGDACTLDSCASDGTCLHTARTCASSDPCKVGVCNSATGCGVTAVTDGTSCGETTCARAHICLDGSCVERDKPGAQDECRYVEVHDSFLYTCALTATGKVRCWGRSGEENYGGNPQGFPFNFLWMPPTTLPTLSGVSTMGVATNAVCGVVGPGQPLCTHDAQLADAGTARVTRLRCPYYGGNCAFITDDGFGHFRMPASFSQVHVPDVRDLTTFGMLVFADGGTNALFQRLLADGGRETLPFVTPAREVVDFYSPTVGLLFEDGTVASSLSSPGDRFFFDGGATHLTQGEDNLYNVDGGYSLCASFAGGKLICRDHLGTETRAQQFSEEIAGLSGGCVLTAGGKVFCPGGDDANVLRTKPTRLPMPKVTGLTTVAPNRYFPDYGVTLALDDDALTLFGGDPFGGGLPAFDGGTVADKGLLGRLPGLKKVDLYRNTTGGSTVTTGYALTDAGRVFTWGLGKPLSLMGGLTDVGDLSVDNGGLLHVAVRSTPTRAVSHEAVLFADGGVYSFASQRVIPLSKPAVAISDRCALLADGSVTCWNAEYDGGFTVASPLGLRPGARQVTGNLQTGCILYGSNGVQCWGRNYFGQLARVGPSSDSAVDIAFNSPLASISTSTTHVCVLTVGGEALCWGHNSGHQLGVSPLKELLPVLQ